MVTRPETFHANTQAHEQEGEQNPEKLLIICYITSWIGFVENI
jgi:hypothetical protein